MEWLVLAGFGGWPCDVFRSGNIYRRWVVVADQKRLTTTSAGSGIRGDGGGSIGGVQRRCRSVCGCVTRDDVVFATYDDWRRRDLSDDRSRGRLNGASDRGSLHSVDDGFANSLLVK